MVPAAIAGIFANPTDALATDPDGIFFGIRVAIFANGLRRRGGANSPLDNGINNILLLSADEKMVRIHTVSYVALVANHLAFRYLAEV